MGFEESTGSKIRSIGNFIDVTQEIRILQKERLKKLNDNKRSQTPEKRGGAIVMNPEQKARQNH